MELYVVRHGQTEYNRKNLFQGHTDIPLNEYFESITLNNCEIRKYIC